MSTAWTVAPSSRPARTRGQDVTGRTKTAVKAKLRQLRQELDNGVCSSATYTFERKGFTVLERQDKTLRGVPIHNYRMAKLLG